jgi:hypothetical protein
MITKKALSPETGNAFAHGIVADLLMAKVRTASCAHIPLTEDTETNYTPHGGSGCPIYFHGF